MKLLHALWYIALILIIVGLVIITSELRGDHIVDARSRELCREYAYRDHEMEIGKVRFEWLAKKGDPNDYEFFYESCLNHLRCPVASNKCNVDNKYMEEK